jgi:DNA polymerase III alpha subunit
MNILATGLNDIYQSLIENLNSDFVLSLFDSEAMIAVDKLKGNSQPPTDLNDPWFYEQLCNGTYPIFKNKPLQKFAAIPDLIQEFAPRNFNDFILLCAVNRIGPLKWAEKILESRKNGKPQDNIVKISDILAESYGVIIYHEQLIDIIEALTGCCCSEAEILIQFTSRIRLFEGYEHVEALFISRAMEHSLITKAEAENIWSQLCSSYCYSRRKNDVIRGALILYRAIYYTLKAE